MKLKTNIFLWVFLSTAAPVCVITLHATTHSENLYRQNVNKEVQDGLSNIVSEIRRRLLLDRDLLKGLSAVPPVTEILPVLKRLQQEGAKREFNPQIKRLDTFFSGFSAILSGTSQFRLLDFQGNTLVPVANLRIPGTPATASLVKTSHETTLQKKAFQRSVRDLVPGEISYILHSKLLRVPSPVEPHPLFDMVLALGEDDHAIGYLTAKVRYEPIDRLLNVSPRFHNGKLFIAEIDPENKERDGLILYDDQTLVEFGAGRFDVGRLQNRNATAYELVQRELFGFSDNPNNNVRTYYSEFLPYPDRLVVWVVGIEIDLRELSAPFNRVRDAILVVGLLALVATFVLARLGTRKIAWPMLDLAEKLKRFSNGERKLRVRIQGADEVRQAGIAFNDMASRFERTEQERDLAKSAMLQKAKLASVGQLAAGIGHEINNPVNNIITLTELMSQSYSSSDAALREDIQSVREEAQRVCRIVKAVLNFAREMPLEHTLFRVEPWLQEILSLVDQEVRRRQLTLLCEVKGFDVLDGDPNLLEQAIVNLLLNAIQASPCGGVVRIEAKQLDGTVSIAVHDEGNGINTSDMERIFDPFFSSRQSDGGSGLGLSISLGIVEQHGGELTLRNRSHRGVTATISLPNRRTGSLAITDEVCHIG